jgi:hypothetical protein
VALRWQQVDLKAGYLDVHRVKRGHDAKHPCEARNCGCCGNCSGPIPTRRMCLCRSEKPPCRRGPFGR